SGRTLADSGPAASAQAPVYCPVYESRLLATARHELNSAAALGVYGGPYGGSQGYGNYVTYGSEASAFYSLAKPRIWSLAHTATAAAATALSQTEFPSCMLKRQGPAAPAAVSSASATSPSVAPARSGALDRHQDSPVTSLRNWVDGVFHDPILRHSTLNQAWATAKGALLDPGPLGRSLGAGANVLTAPLARAFPPTAPQPVGKEEKELELSDLDDFDPLEADPPGCDLKPPFQSLDSGLERVPAAPDDRVKEASGALRMPLAA
ncbi:PREDICTED: iroquois-class homeodomain protein IRX-4, partial [Colobus angolensis palliatus]|uniref:iroquois-class homeodomain protein IRX-4 n=1 Tax=Colobus angolensis palliatus TaxID=336983 RepID=UPI0005F38D7A